MRPILLHGHSRAITKIRFNTEGDLIFSTAKDNVPVVWRSYNGERLGTFNGHNGAVWDIDCNWDTTKVVTGSADSTLRIWDCETGACINKLTVTAPIRSCNFSYSGNLLVYTTDDVFSSIPEINIIDVNSGEHMNGKDKVLSLQSIIDGTSSKSISTLWGAFDESVVTGHENGTLAKWDLRNGEVPLIDIRPHSAQINDMQFNDKQNMFITASKDNVAKLFDLETFEELKIFPTERPVNSATISPLLDHVILGGGQEAMEAALKASETGKFEARFFHLVFEEEFARVQGHFGPIQSLAFHPDGKGYASGAEDGYIRVHRFDPEYFNFKLSFE